MINILGIFFLEEKDKCTKMCTVYLLKVYFVNFKKYWSIIDKTLFVFMGSFNIKHITKKLCFIH